MTLSLRRLATAALAAVALSGIPMISPAVSSACREGETGVTNGCAPFCTPDKALDTRTGLCVRVPNPSPDGVNPPIY
jgi:hypothetical protein